MSLSEGGRRRGGASSGSAAATNDVMGRDNGKAAAAAEKMRLMLEAEAIETERQAKAEEERMLRGEGDDTVSAIVDDVIGEASDDEPTVTAEARRAVHAAAKAAAAANNNAHNNNINTIISNGSSGQGGSSTSSGAPSGRRSGGRERTSSSDADALAAALRAEDEKDSHNSGISMSITGMHGSVADFKRTKSRDNAMPVPISPAGVPSRTSGGPVTSSPTTVRSGRPFASTNAKHGRGGRDARLADPLSNIRRNAKGGIHVNPQELKQAFEFFDTDNKGFITIQDLKKRLGVFYDNLSLREYKFLMNNKQELTEQDLYYLLAHNELTNYDPVEEAFKIYDPRGEGFIDEAVFKSILVKLGFGSISDQDVQTLIETADIDKDGRVSLLDFRKMLPTQRADAHSPLPNAVTATTASHAAKLDGKEASRR